MSGLPRGLLPVLAGANFVIGAGAFLVIGALAPISRDLGLTPAQAGWILTTYALAYAVLSPLLVSLTGGIGRRRVMTLGMVLFGLGALGSALAPSAGGLLAARVVAAAGAGLTTPVTAAVAALLSAPEMRGKVLAYVFMGITLAGVIGVPGGSWIAYTYGWRTAFWAVAVLSAVFAVVLWLRVPAGLRFQPVRLRDLGGVLGDWKLMLAIGFTAVFLAAIYVPFTYLAPLLEARMGLGRDGVTVALLIAGLGGVAGNLVGGWLSDRLGPYATLLWLCGAQAALMPLLSLLPIPLGLAFLLLLAWNAAGFAFNSSQQIRVVVLAGARAPVALALNAACIYVGAAIGSALGAGVIDGFGLSALGVAGGITVLAAVAALVLSQRLTPVDRGASGA
ncbi:MFS transporter [Jannaschia seohaensis]|uniref:Predicted arabinose efflux permease, MFS family n=1 Tax=Jannaschia seohaensis TaxID=475081 RepID=A0A2Y9A910_9RHOB|nr:MFS transporter [Jannaschia seohaensis]PWJ22409.1 putative MFS family arabinose efflux permease [Jannaschia seohaensis]SSA38687.1 Predicted arabinose efflux permease, MFS family [Jannaschia seohaensis]